MIADSNSPCRQPASPSGGAGRIYLKLKNGDILEVDGATIKRKLAFYVVTRDGKEVARFHHSDVAGCWKGTPEEPKK